jgi:hemoglobin
MYRFGKRFCSRNTLLRKSFPPHKQLPVAKEHFDRWMEIFTSTTDELFVEPLRKKLNYAPRIWQKCSITKLTILEMLDKWRSSEFEITLHAQFTTTCFFSFTFVLL